MNPPAIFQAMMNKILEDMINKGKVTAFVDNVLIETEIEEGHCSDLAWGNLITLLVWVDKENSIEFSFDYSTLLIHILCLLLFINSHISLLIVLSHMSTNFLIKQK